MSLHPKLSSNLITSPPSLLPPPPPSFLGLHRREKRGRFGKLINSVRCKSGNHQGGGSSNTSTTQEIQEKKVTLQTDQLPLINWPQLPVDDPVVEFPTHPLKRREEIESQVERIKSMLRSMEDGEISVSPYDTAWVALVEDIGGSGKPQFPESVEWICRNQLRDGSWGDPDIFHAHDRIINTLACVVALTFWSLHPHKCHQGMEFIRENLSKLREEKDEHMLIGFEVAFPSLLEMAKGLGISLIDDSGVIQEIYARRSVKLSRIPLDILHMKPTSLLHSIEGMVGLDWEKLMKLQSKDGSFLFSPSSTAFALMNTKDLNCLAYLQPILNKFNGGVPNVYPTDLFEHLWVVDRLERLGISRFFESEIDDCMNYVYRYWTESGICWARNSEVQDIDDTAMGFRLLRLHGYHVSADVFKNFEKNGEFFCFAGQSTQAMTGMFNLYRASQVQFPGEGIMERAREFSSKYLREKQSSNQVFDKWVILKDLPGEVSCALDLPWYSSLPRIHTRFYIDQYGGEDDVWIGKTLYKMPFVNNNIYLELAKLDYNTCQTTHLLEWNTIKRWYADHNLNEFGLTQKDLLRLFFVAVASIYEPERSNERLAWAKTSAMVTAISAYFSRQSEASHEQRWEFADQFLNTWNSYRPSGTERREKQGLVGQLLGTLNQISFDVLVDHGVDIQHHLRQAWEKWMATWVEDGDRYKGEAELIARTVHVCTKNGSLEGDNFTYSELFEATNGICHQLGQHLMQSDNYSDKQELNALQRKPIPAEVNTYMQRLLRMVLSDLKTKHIFWDVARSYYYLAYCSYETIDFHLAKVLFERVE